MTIWETEDELVGIQENFDRLADLGLFIHLTELTIMCGRTGGSSTPNACPVYEGQNWTTAMLEDQANVYKGLLDICLNTPACLSYESWGYTDKYSDKVDPQNALIFDREYNKKDAYYSLLDDLNQANRSSEVVQKRFEF